MRILCAFLLFLFTAPVLAQAKDDDNIHVAFRYGAWTGRAAYEEGQFRFCAMSAHYVHGIVMAFLLKPDLQWAVMFAKDNGFPRNAPRQFQFYIDGQHKLTDTANPVGDSGLIMPLPDSAPLMRDMRAGRMLSVVSGHGTTRFSLRGTSQAFVELYNCVRKHDRVAAGGGAFGGGGRVAASPPQPAGTGLDAYRVPRDVLVAEMANIFSESGVKAYRFMPYEENKSVGEVVWQWPDNSFSGISVYRNIPNVALAREEGEILRVHASGCKGNFVSGRRAPGQVGQFEVRKLFAHCTAGIQSVYFEYALLLHPGQYYVKFVDARFGGAESPSAPAGEQANVQDALLRRFASERQ
jgi:hypothetical protein